MSQTADDARFAELEIKLSYCEDLLETLNRTVYQQQQLIERLQHEIRAIREQRQADGGANGADPLRDPRDETPPHY